jgi:hypothetical protein
VAACPVLLPEKPAAGPACLSRALPRSHLLPFGQLAVAALIAAVAVLAVLLARTELADAIRRLFQRLGPEDVLELVVWLVVLGLVLRLGLRYERVETLRARSARPLRVLQRVPTAIVLTAVVAVAAGFRIALAGANGIPRFLPDELLHADLAKAFAVHGQPLVRGEFELGRTVFFPLFASPAYRFAPDGAAAFEAVQWMNAIAMALAAVPAYFLARRIVSRGWSLVVAAFVAFAPWTAYSALMLTEPLFYLAFTTFALVVVRMLERPTWSRQLVTLAALAVLVGVRSQALALTLSVIGAIVLTGAVERRLRATFVVYRPTLILLGLALLAGAVLAFSGLPFPTSDYTAIWADRFGVIDLGKWAIWNLVVYGLALGVIPLVAFPLSLHRLLRRGASEAERAVGVASVSLFAGVLLSVAVLSASPEGHGILHDRTLFYVTPLVLACFAHWLTSGQPRPMFATAVVVAVAVGMAMTVPERVLLETNNVEGLVPSVVQGLKEHEPGVAAQLWVVGFTALGCGALVVLRRSLFPLLGVALAFAVVAAANDYTGPIDSKQTRALGWVDRALPRGAEATLVHMGFTRPDQPCRELADYEQQGLVLWTEFFNRDVGRVVHVSEQVKRDLLASPELTVGPGGVMLQDGRPFAPPYAVLDSRQPIVGTRLARFDLGSLGPVFPDGASLTLWKVDPPLRLLAHAQPLPPRANGADC